jgi:hypothetical protein
MPIFSMKLTACFILSIIILTGCSDSDDLVTWEYTIPDGYEGWVAIQHDCIGGEPLDRQEDVIRVTFSSDGLFCTTDSFFPWTGQRFAQNISGSQIPVIGQPKDNTGYVVCCGQALRLHISDLGQQVDVELQLMWVGNLDTDSPSLNTQTISEDALDGSLVPLGW